MAAQKKTALVLSGGGNRGALQAGALIALFESGFQPDIIVGTSAGALNAAFLAPYPTLAQARRLARVWRHTTKDDIFPGSRLRMAVRALAGKPSLFPNDHFYQFLLDNSPLGHCQFSDLSSSGLYIVAAHRANNALRLFGDLPFESVIDALMASAAIPPLFPPWCYNDEILIDGGVAANPAVSVALSRGATEVWVVHIENGVTNQLPKDNLFAVSLRMILQALREVSKREMALLEKAGGKAIIVRGFEHLPPWDYDHTEEMIASGYQQACRQLDELLAEPVPIWRRLFQRFVTSSKGASHTPAR